MGKMMMIGKNDESIEQKCRELTKIALCDFYNSNRALYQFFENDNEVKNFFGDIDDLERRFAKKSLQTAIVGRLNAIICIVDLLRDLTFNKQASNPSKSMIRLNRTIGKINISELWDADAVAERQKKFEKSQKPQKKC